MKSCKAFNPHNTLALLSLARFEDVKVVDETIVSFRFNGETYEAIRLEGWLCIGTIRDHYSMDEFWAVMKAGEDLMKQNPFIQFFYSGYEDYFRIRLWVECNNTLDFEKALFRGINELDSINDTLQIRSQHHMFEMIAPTFDRILNK